MTNSKRRLQVLMAAGWLAAGPIGPACAGEARALAGTESRELEIAQPPTTCLSKPDDTLELPYKYVGNNFSLKFHRPSCLFAKAMAPVHVELFHFRKQAVDAGMHPCRYCLPADWKTVRAILLANPRSPE